MKIEAAKIEQVARAIYEAWAKEEECVVTWDEVQELSGMYGYPAAKRMVRLAFAEARAAIEAMRDVDSGSPEILRAGKQSLYSCSSDPELEDARQCWQAMIDAALEEGK